MPLCRRLSQSVAESREVFPEFVFDLRVPEGMFDRRLDEPELTAAVVSFPNELQGHHLPVLQEASDAIGKLDLAVAVCIDVPQSVEDVWRQDVATDYAQVGRRLVGRRFFDDGFDLAYPIYQVGAGFDHAVFVGIPFGDGLDRQYGGMISFMNLDHLRDATGIGIDEIVGQDYGECFVPNDGAGAGYGVSEAERSLLPDVDAMHVSGKDRAHVGEQMVFAAGLQRDLQFTRAVEVILDGPFLTPGDEDKLMNARCHRLFDGILDQGFVDDGEHFLGACLGGGEKSRPQSRDGKDGLFDSRIHCFACGFRRSPIILSRKSIMERCPPPGRKCGIAVGILCSR